LRPLRETHSVFFPEHFPTPNSEDPTFSLFNSFNAASHDLRNFQGKFWVQKRLGSRDAALGARAKLYEKARGNAA
jgi:hypothetical protein